MDVCHINEMFLFSHSSSRTSFKSKLTDGDEIGNDYWWSFMVESIDDPWFSPQHTAHTIPPAPKVPHGWPDIRRNR